MHLTKKFSFIAKVFLVCFAVILVTSNAGIAFAQTPPPFEPAPLPSQNSGPAPDPGDLQPSANFGQPASNGPGTPAGIQGGCDSGFKNVNGLCIPQNTLNCGSGGLACQDTAGNLIIQIIKILLTLSGVIAVLFVVIGGFWYIMAGGNEEQSKKGKKTITAALVGLAIVILAYVIVTVITKTLTTGV